jgi:predicted nucleotidyltransferase
LQQGGNQNLQVNHHDMLSTKINIEAARAFQKKKRLDRQAELELKHRDALYDFQQIVDMIVRKYKPKRIYQWGSLLNKEHFSELSDIDIAVEGLPDAQSYFNMLADAEKLTSFPLDIVEMESIHELHKNMIIQKGVLVYERK